MEIKLKDRMFIIPDDCPLDGPKKSTLRRNLQEHGAESFLTSRKLSPFAGCLTEELLVAGAVVVGTKVTGAETILQPLTSYVESSTPEGIAGMETSSRIWVAPKLPDQD